MARTAEQNKKIRDAKRELILSTALDLFSLKGYYSTRISDIAESAGIAQGLLYYYYPSKEAIYVDLVEDALERINETARFVRDMDKPYGYRILYALRVLFKTIGVELPLPPDVPHDFAGAVSGGYLRAGAGAAGQKARRGLPHHGGDFPEGAA